VNDLAKHNELYLPDNIDGLVKRLSRLRKERKERKQHTPHARRLSLTTDERSIVRAKTDSRCHLCGGGIAAGERFAADHVLAHAVGGEDKIENYLAAHRLCNGTRWFYSPEEFQWILRMGMWARNQIEKETLIGRDMVEAFLRYEKAIRKRRKAVG
jgi:hypothetical protein